MLRFLCVYKHVMGEVNRTLNEAPLKAAVLFALALMIGAFVSIRSIDGEKDALRPLLLLTLLRNGLLQNIISSHQSVNPFVCSENQTKMCPAYVPSSTIYFSINNTKSPSSCPDYFRWIHEDLRPWNGTGISREMVERARRTAHFRLVILNGTAYVETLRKAFQTRDVFTLWGIVQLLRRYPGRLPDLELLFDCNDTPVVKLRNSHEGEGEGEAPPALFAYCGNDETMDIVFPDWSFWGW